VARVENFGQPGNADAAPESATTLARGAGGRRDRFSTIQNPRRGVCRSDKVLVPCHSVAAHSLQECRRALARRRRQLAHLEFLDPLCGMVQVCRRSGAVGQRVAGGSTRDVATLTGAQVSSDSGQHVQARRTLRSREVLLSTGGTAMRNRALSVLRARQMIVGTIICLT
jgi:hypothetical protein